MDFISYDTSLIFSMIIFIFSIILSLFFYPLFKDKIKAFYCIPIYYLILLTGIILLFISDEKDVRLLSFFGYNLILFATLLLVSVIARIKKVNINLFNYIVIFSVFVFLYSHYFFVHKNEGIHIIIFVTYMLVIHGYIAYILIRKRLKTCILLCIINFMLIAIYLAHDIYTIVSIINNYNFTNNSEDGLFFFVFASSSLLFLFGLITHINAENELKIIEQSEENQKLADIFIHSPLPVVMIDLTGDIIMSNQVFDILIKKRCSKRPCNLKNIISKNDFDTILTDISDKKISNEALRYEMAIYLDNNELLIHDLILKRHHVNKKMFIIYFIDVTYQNTAKEEINKISEMLNRTRSSTSIGFWDLSMNKKIIVADENARDIYEMQLEPEEIPLEKIQKLVLNKYRNSLDEALKNLIADNVPYDIEFEIETHNGNRKFIHSKAYKENVDGDINIKGTIQDITLFKKQEEKIIFLETYDSLTGLHNKDYFTHFIESETITEGKPVSIIICDIDGLSIINETFGFESGNKLLKDSANILMHKISGKHLIARTGDDEFSIIVKNVGVKLAEDILDVVKKALESDVQIARKYNFEWTFGFATSNKSDKKLADVFSRARSVLQNNKLYRATSVHRKTLEAVMKTLNEKDPLSEIHSRKVAYYAKLLANALNLPKEQINKIETAALLHDIGKIVIADEILTKSGKLTDEEYNIIKQHPIIGYNIMNVVEEMKELAPIILSHHERVDGLGYPYGIKGDKIPFEAKIISIADAFDAMVGKRTYREPYENEEAILELLDNKGTQFDEELVNIFTDAILKYNKNV